MFGIDRDAKNERLIRLLTDFANVGVASPLLLAPPLQRDLGRYSPWGRVMRLRRETDQAIYAEIARRRSESPDESRHDILSLLLQVKDEDGQPLTDRAVRDEVVTMLMAGHETTGTALAWAFERILSLPEVQAKIEAELESVSGGGPLLTEHMAKLEYLQAVIDETHRAFITPAPPGSNMCNEEVAGPPRARPFGSDPLSGVGTSCVKSAFVRAITSGSIEWPRRYTVCANSAEIAGLIDVRLPKNGLISGWIQNPPALPADSRGSKVK